MKPLVGMAALGFTALAFWKILSVLFLPLFGTLFLPLFGMLAGMVLLVVKVALVGALVFLLVWWLRKDKKEDGESPPS